MPRPPHAGLGNQYSDTRAVSKADRAAAIRHIYRPEPDPAVRLSGIAVFVTTTAISLANFRLADDPAVSNAKGTGYRIEPLRSRQNTSFSATCTEGGPPI